MARSKRIRAPEFDAVCRRELRCRERTLLASVAVALATLDWPSLIMLEIAANLLGCSGEDDADPGLELHAMASGARRAAAHFHACAAIHEKI